MLPMVFRGLPVVRGDQVCESKTERWHGDDWKSTASRRQKNPGLTEQQFVPAQRGGGRRISKAAPNDDLQRRPVSKRVNSSKADPDSATLIAPVQLAPA